MPKKNVTAKLKVGDLVVVSNTNFNKIKVLKKLKDSISGPYVIKAFHGENSVEVELSKDLSNKHPTFSASLMKPQKDSDSEKDPLRNKAPQHILPFEASCTKKITKFLKERELRTKKVREYIVRYSEPACEDELLAGKDIP
ncbi:hypothetical protein O181_081624 [Austropuccinia psidii MF-1]|uniref:Uncharacterized protein n=1 Tax=Austropuccinia psidii MF-1 TaxID=1389203 RepID=A0A9Q3FN66_9BASI|nr:hypothetical protein [Austropuccinia psidii MF-1]